MGLFDKALQNLGLGDVLGGGDAPAIQQADTLNPEQQQLLQSILGGLGGITAQGLTPVDFQSAGTSGLQNQAFGGIGGIGQQGFGIAGQMLGGFDPAQAQNFLGQAGGALSQGLQGVGTQAITDAFAPSRQLATNQFQQQTIPNLLERFGASSGGSGALQSQLANAGSNLSLGLRAQEAPFIGQAALNAPGQQFQGAGLAGQLAGIPGQLAGQGVGLSGNILQQLLAAGGTQRGIEGDRISALNQSALQPQSLLGQFAPLGLGTQAFTNFQQQQQPSLLQSLAPAIGTAAGAFFGGPGGAALGSSLGGLFSGGGSGGGTTNSGFGGLSPQTNATNSAQLQNLFG